MSDAQKEQQDFERLRSRMATGKLEQRALTRACQAVRVPAGDIVALEPEWEVTILRRNADAFIVQIPLLGGEFRIDANDADAMGMIPDSQRSRAGDSDNAPEDSGSLEERVRTRLCNVYDPELPVNILDLGLVYGIALIETRATAYRAEIELTLTTQACGMGAMISRDIQTAVSGMSEIDEVDVRIVWDPPWTPKRITAAGRAKLGIE